MSAGSCLIEKTSVPQLEWNENTFKSLNGTLSNNINDEQQYAVNFSSNFQDGQEFKEILKERDDVWRQHERARLGFVQDEHSKMLEMLHLEIEQLQCQLFRATQSQLENCEIQPKKQNSIAEANNAELRRELETAKTELKSCRKTCESKNQEIAHLEGRLNDMQLSYENRIAELENRLIKGQENVSSFVEKKCVATATSGKSANVGETKKSVGSSESFVKITAAKSVPIKKNVPIKKDVPISADAEAVTKKLSTTNSSSVSSSRPKTTTTILAGKPSSRQSTATTSSAASANKSRGEEKPPAKRLVGSSERPTSFCTAATATSKKNPQTTDKPTKKN